jgi:bifunctional enzyme CysN/CysC
MGTPQEVVRLCTMGSVDDGKSTLIGRLLHDSRVVLDDHLAHVRETSARRGWDGLDLSLITDGLRAEREQGITIDVAYRYFASGRRRFILADTPGHVQYTRNTVTGASTAQLSLLLLDAERGIGEQARRHTFVASLLGVPHLLVCVNKMDRVGWSQSRFAHLRADLGRFTSLLSFRDVTFIPVSALLGDNVVERSSRMPWYEGPTLLGHLEGVEVAADLDLATVRLPVQYVIRERAVSGAAGRWYAGQLASGVVRVGDEVAVLPAGLRTRVSAIANGRPVEEAFPPMSVRLRLADDLDVSRGDMLVGIGDGPAVVRDIDAIVCSLGSEPIREGQRVVILHTTRATPGVITRLAYRIDVNTLERDPAVTELGPNEIGRATIRAASPLFYDPYRANRATGSLVLVDEATNATIAGAMVVDPRDNEGTL